ncbi:regulator of chromosome condensation (RCC1) repeat-containing protein [Toxoplasma gondii RUB]|uniref:Regulator of chromosome condensation (RCC1) repeat-containing protein n=1 Tax=Toxoplasma gondii RUB TaxID=935652 RepID=A0A086MA68_TOXGO|nr:regulator of chromosome condensation (RCC1) repeat-containing protein [Toxoplasma gondii RUB]
MGEGKHFFPCVSRICKMKRHPSAASSFSPGRPASTGGVPAPFWSSSEETKDRSWRRVFHRATLPRIPRSGLAAAAALFVLSQSRPASSSAPSPRLSSSASQPRRPVLRAGGEGLDAPPSPPPASRARTDTPLSRAASVSMEARLERRMQSRNASAATASLFSGGSLARCAGLQAGDAETGRTQKTQQILMWGDRKALPGGASSDIATPTEITWFADQAAARAPWRQISFGPDFGVAVNEKNQAALWGSFSQKPEAQEGDSGDAGSAESTLHFVSPFYLDLSFKVVDAQCSAAELFLLSSDGRVFVLDKPHDLFARLLQSASSASSPSSPSSSSSSSSGTERGLCVTKTADGTLSVACGVRLLSGLPPDREGAEACEAAAAGLATRWARRALRALGTLTGWADCVVKMNVGGTHAAFVTRRGELYCCGENLFGECGVEPRPFDEASLRVSAHRVDFSDADPDRIWNGHGNREPQIVDVSCGLHHTICLSKDGKVYAFGDDSKIQLGLGDTRSNQQGVAGTTWMQRVKGNKVSIPRAVSYTYADRHLQHKPVAVLPPTGFPGIKQCAVTAVAAGDDFSLLLFQDAHQPFADELLKRNALFCCGETARGQCGRTLQQQQQVLSPVVFPRSASAVTSPSSFLVSSSRDLPGPSSIFCAEKIACGSKHCLALMASGKLVGWGFNAHGQVGTGGRVKGAISPPRTIAVDSEETPELPSSSEKDRETPGRLSPPLPRYLASEDGLPNFAIKNVFCNFNASAAIRAR